MSDETHLPAQVAGEIAGAFIPGTGAVVTRMFDTVRAEWSRFRSHAMKAAEATSGMSREDLAEQIEAHPELVPLVTRLLHEAAMTGQHKVLEAMGAAFGAAARHPDQCGKFEPLLRELPGLQSDDVLLLREVVRKPVFRRNKAEDLLTETERFQTAEAVADRLGLPIEEVVTGLVRLRNHGFSMTAGAIGGTHFEASSNGALLVDALRLLSG